MDANARLLEGVPNPRPHAAVEDPDQAPAIRRLHCRRYDDCLDVAIAAGWPGFTCAGCAAFEALSAVSEERDYRGLVELAANLLAANDNTTKRPLHDAAVDETNEGEEKTSC